MRNYTMTVGGKEIKGCSIKDIQSPGWNELLKPPSQPSWRGIEISAKGSCQIFASHKAIWYLKNELFINNRPPRGMRVSK